MGWEMMFETINLQNKSARHASHIVSVSECMFVRKRISC